LTQAQWQRSNCHAIFLINGNFIGESAAIEVLVPMAGLTNAVSQRALRQHATGAARWCATHWPAACACARRRSSFRIRGNGVDDAISAAASIKLLPS
jgi:hypothetical protein